jgi:hypothetical protein
MLKGRHLLHIDEKKRISVSKRKFSRKLRENKENREK